MTPAETKATVRALKAAGGREHETALALGISISTLYRRKQEMKDKGVAFVPSPGRVRGEAVTDAELLSLWTTYERLGYNAVQTADALGISRNIVNDRAKMAEERLCVQRKSLGATRAREADKLALPPSGKIKRYILTCAQNNTLVHAPTWASLLQLAEHYDAEIKVSTFTYIGGDGSEKRGTEKNRGKTIAERWYANEITEYISDGFEQLAPGLVWCGHSNTLPTASDPLTGAESMNGRNSGVWPHTTIQMRPVATMNGEPTKFNWTTGAVTLRNYIQKRAGQRGEFHHAFGGLLVEVAPDGAWWCRQLNADSEGTIYDLDTVARPAGVSKNKGVEALVYGDIHEATIDEDIRQATWGNGGMADTLKPRLQVFHDVLDFESRSHHSRKDPHEMYRLWAKGKDSVRNEIYRVGRFLEYAAMRGQDNVVICSNHDRHLDRWLKETDWRDDVPNAEFYIDAQKAMLAAVRADTHFMPLAWALETMGFKGFRLNPLDKSLVILKDKGGGIELGLHGDLGPNGSRGTPRNLSRLGRKTIIGDKHAPGIWDGCYVAGVTGKLHMGYNTGPSSWAHAHVVVYENGKRQVLVFWRGAYSAADYMRREKLRAPGGTVKVKRPAKP